MSAVFFDMDGTLINGDTNDQSTRFYLQQGLVGPEFLEPVKAYAQSFFAGTLKIEEFIGYIVSPLLPLSAAQQRQILRRLVAERIVPLFKPGALEAIARHRRRGDTLVIVTSTVDYLVQYVAEALGISEIIAAPIGTDEGGRIIGGVTGVVPYQEGKVLRIEEFMERKHLSWQDSYAYGDSVNDLPMLLKAEHGVAVDPNLQLKMHPDFVRLACESWL